MSEFFLTAIVTFVGSFIGVPILLWLVKFLGVYAIVEERQCLVFSLFGKVEAIIDEPGLHILPFSSLGLKSFIVNFFGSVSAVDLRMDQQYLRSQQVNSEEGAPMGIGIWYEMFISDPVAFLFRNTDPRGSLSANVSNATVRCLSNMKLSDMLENRHSMSHVVRDEVSAKSHEWGYRLGSVYIRKVHFRDAGMIRQIEEKVVNRLRQVTSAIRQHGSNQVQLISSAAERQAAIEFAKASAMRPAIVGKALDTIGRDPEVMEALFEILENEKIIKSNSSITLIPAGSGDDARKVLGNFIAAESVTDKSGRDLPGGHRPPPQLPGNSASNLINLMGQNPTQ